MSTRIVAVTGARDGVGRTTFAVNMALSLIKETRSRVLLLDLDGESVGDCQALLGLPLQGEQAARSAVDFAPYTDQLTSDQFRQYISAHPAGMGVIPLAPSPERSAELSLDKLQELLGLALPLCDYMVVDCGVGLNDRSLKIFEQAAGIFVLATPDLSVLRHTRRLVESLQRLQFPAELLKVVANKVPAKGALGPDKMTQVLGRKVMVTLPNESTVANKAEMEANPCWVSPESA